MGGVGLFRTLFLALVLAAAWLLPARAGMHVALAVGNSDYMLILPLATPEDDAAWMAEILRGVGFDVVEAKNADRWGMARDPRLRQTPARGGTVPGTSSKPCGRPRGNGLSPTRQKITS